MTKKIKALEISAVQLWQLACGGALVPINCHVINVVATISHQVALLVRALPSILDPALARYSVLLAQEEMKWTIWPIKSTWG